MLVRGVLLVLLALGAGCNSLLDLGGEFTLGGPVDAMALDADPGAPDATVDGGPAAIRALALGTNFAVATAALIDVRTQTATLEVLAGALDRDPVVRRSNGETFVVNRGSDEVLVIDEVTLAVLATFQLPAGSSPQDVAASNSQLYVPGFSSSGILRVARSDGAVTPIPLLQTVDPDGKPNCNSIFFSGSRVYITCGILDDTAGFVPRGVGKLVVYDPFGDTVVRVVDLPFPNPFGLLQPTHPAAPSTGALVIGTANFTTVTTGCLVSISLASPEVATCLVDNADLGGYVQRAEADAAGEVLWINSATFSAGGSLGRVVSYPLAGGSLSLPITDPGEEIVDLAVCPDGYLLVSDRKSPAGVRVYLDGVAVGGAQAIDLGQPPVYNSGVVCL